MAGAGNLGAMADVFQCLPQIFSVVQVVVYVFAVLFFGSVALSGYRGYLGWHRRLALRLALGLISVVAGIGITPMLSIENQFLKMVQLDLMIGMLIASAILLAALKLMTLNVPCSIVLKDRIKHLEEKLNKRGDKNAPMPESRLKHPAAVIGLVMLIGLVGFSLVNFRGFPDMKENIFSSLGLTDKDIEQMNEAIKQFQSSPFANLSASCLAAIQEMQGKGELYKNPPVYTDAALKSAIEREANGTVAEMYKMDSNGKSLVVALLAGGRQCYATTGEFCICS